MNPKPKSGLQKVADVHEYTLGLYKDSYVKAFRPKDHTILYKVFGLF